MSYQLGRRVNILAWCLEEFIFRGVKWREDSARLEHSLSELIRLVMPDPAAARAQRVLHQSMVSWRSILDDEGFGDRNCETIEAYCLLAARPGSELPEQFRAVHACATHDPACPNQPRMSRRVTPRNASPIAS